jgi:hypothetical protein
MPQISIGSLFLRLYLSVYLAVGFNVPLALAQTPSAENTPAASPSQIADQRQSVLDALARLQDIERNSRTLAASPGQVFLKTGTDHEAIFAWVRDRTALVPYRGSLRGPQGVLMDLDGNALDRSLLFQHLLTLAGYETRLARAELNRDQALALAQGIGVSPRRPEFEDTNQTPDPELEAALQTAFDRIESQTLDLVELTASYRRSTELQREAELDQAVLALTDHWWVQSRIDGEWQDLDPSLPKPGRAIVPATATYDATALPEELLHRIKIRLVLETWRDGRPKKEALLELTAAARDLAGKTLHIGHVPLGIRGADVDLAGDIPSLFDQLTVASAWLPLIAFDGKIQRSRLFTADGEVMEATEGNISRFHEVSGTGAMSGGIADTLQAMGDLFGSLPSGDSESASPSDLSGEDPPALQNVTAEWLEYEVIVPGEAPQTVRRTIFDLVGHGARLDGESSRPGNTVENRRQVVAGLLGETYVAVETAKVMPEMLLSRAAAKLGAIRPFLEEVKESNGAVSEQQLQQYLPALRTLQVDLDSLETLRWRWNWSNDALFVDRPNVMALKTAVRIRPSGDWVVRRSIDIVANSVAARPLPGLDSFSTRVMQGVTDTVAEASLTGGSERQGNASDLHEAAKQAGNDPVVFSLADISRLDQVVLSTEARARITEDLRAGNIVVIPGGSSETENGNELAWWRIDPSSGATLGIGESGAGQAMVEYLVNTIIFLVTIADLYFFAQCIFGGAESVFFGAVSLQGLSDGGRASLCFVEAIAFEITGVALAKALGGVFRAAGAGGRGADDVLGGAGRGTDDVAGTGGRAGDDVAGTGGRAGDDVAGTGGRAGDDVAGTGGRAGDDVAGTGGRAGDDAAGTGGRAGDDVAGTGGRAGDDVAGTGGRAGDDVAGAGGRAGDDVAGAGGRAGDDVAGAGGRAGDDVAGAGGRGADDVPPGRPSPELARGAGRMQEPWIYRTGEGVRPASARDALPGSPMRLDPNVSETYHYVVKGDGTITYAPQVIRNGRETVKHTDLAENAPARIAGEITYNAERNVWIMDNSSGRYSFWGVPGVGMVASTRTPANLESAIELARQSGTDASILPRFSHNGFPYVERLPDWAGR